MDEHREMTAQEAYDEGFEQARYRFEREIDYLKGQITALQHQNEMIVKQMAAALAFVPQSPIFVKAGNLTGLDQ